MTNNNRIVASPRKRNPFKPSPVAVKVAFK